MSMRKHDYGVALYPPPEVGGFTATEDKNPMKKPMIMIIIGFFCEQCSIISHDMILVLMVGRLTALGNNPVLQGLAFGGK